MAGNTKTVRKGFDYLHCDDFAAYLEEMAQKGWHFKQWSAGLVFERGEPRETEYAVEVFMDGSEYDTRPEPHTKEFAEYCEAAGWRLVDAKRKFCIFEKIRPDAVEILTDEERLSNIAKEEQKNIWHHLIISAVWSCMKLLEFTSVSFANNIFSNASLLITAVWLLFLITSIGRAVHFYIWKFRMEARIRRGEPVYFGSGKKSGLGMYPLHNWLSLTGYAMYLIGCWYFGQSRMVLFFFGYLGVLLLMGYLIAKFRPESTTNALIQTLVPALLFVGLMVVSLYQVVDSDTKRHDAQQIPLYPADIALEFGDMKSSTGYIHSSIFGTHTAYSLSYEGQHTMFYVAYLTEEDWILDRIWKTETDGAANRNQTDCADEWGADEGFRNGNGKYYLRYPDGILIFTIYDEFEPTAEQIDIILEKLDLR